MQWFGFGGAKRNEDTNLEPSRTPPDDLQEEPQGLEDTKLEGKEWKDLTRDERIIAKKMNRQKMMEQLEREREYEKKVDARLADLERERDLYDDLNHDEQIATGPGSYDKCVGTYEILKSFSFFVLFLAGCFIGTRNYSLQKCRSVDTAQNINYCVRIFYNTTENVQFRCVGINEEEIPGDASTQCCVNAVRAGLVDPQACTTRVTGGDGSFECHDPAAFEDLCRDVNSCPGDLVNSFQTAIILYAFTLFGFSLVAAARGYGLHAYSQFHYMDFFENRLNWFDVATFTCAKIGTRIEQWWLVLLNIPAFVWFSYYSQVAITDFCGNAVSEGGGTWELPVAANSWFAFSVVWATACMVTSTLLRYNYEVRPEIYDPQPGNVGCTFCGYRLDCHKSRAQSVCSSSAFCGEKCYDRTRVSLKHSLGRCCKNSCVPGKYLLWYPVWWLIYLSNVIFWLTCGPFGYLLEQWAAKKHWISV